MTASDVLRSFPVSDVAPNDNAVYVVGYILNSSARTAYVTGEITVVVGDQELGPGTIIAWMVSPNSKYAEPFIAKVANYFPEAHELDLSSAEFAFTPTKVTYK